MIMVSVIVVAAGKGSRMKSSVNKQFLKLKGKAVLQHTIEIFLEVEEIDEMVVVLSKEDVALFQSLDFLGKEKVKIALGGQERYFSVRNGLEQVSEDSDVILVHDGARPFVTKEEIKSVISCARQDGACILATKVKDTIKEVECGVVVNTPKRDRLYAVQTPQGFRGDILREVYAMDFCTFGDWIPTDDASLVERQGYPIKITEGSPNNIKITTPIDLLLGELILEQEELL